MLRTGEGKKENHKGDFRAVATIALALPNRLLQLYIFVQDSSRLQGAIGAFLSGGLP
jgi:hypothetical protein